MQTFDVAYHLGAPVDADDARVRIERQIDGIARRETLASFAGLMVEVASGFAVAFAVVRALPADLQLGDLALGDMSLARSLTLLVALMATFVTLVIWRRARVRQLRTEFALMRAVLNRANAESGARER